MNEQTRKAMIDKLVDSILPFDPKVRCEPVDGKPGMLWLSFTVPPGLQNLEPVQELPTRPSFTLIDYSSSGKASSAETPMAVAEEIHEVTCTIPLLPSKVW